MDPGSRSGEIAGPFPFTRVVAVWMLLMLAETLHGIVREVFTAPVIGDLHARQVGVLVGSAIIFFIAWAAANWMGARTPRSQIIAGAIWVALTLAFEILLGLALGLGWGRILADYNLARGGFMPFGLAFMLFAPRLAAKLRGP
jgi:hypothetical protein